MTEYVTSVRSGETLLTALYRGGRYLQAACGGHGRCRRCRVRVVDGPETRPAADDLHQEGDYKVTAAYPVGIDPVSLPETASTGRTLGLAVDLGTTTVAAALVDTETGEVLARAARPNAQIAYGEDVLSRIRFGFDDEHRERLADLVRHAVDALLVELLEETGLSAEDVTAVTLAGNASMTLLFLGRDTSLLATPPYEPGLSEEGVVLADPDVLLVPGSPPTVLLPSLGGHVGGDTTAAILASGLLSGDLPALLVDLGTNGEVVLATEHAVLATSSAAGPAFEGGAIQKGSPARPGAVEHVEVVSGELVLTTIGGKEPVSWCGSGVLEITAALREIGGVDRTGLMLGKQDIPLPFTQGDVREVQLAKGAVAAAEKILCWEAGIKLGAVRRIVLTGAFGSRLRAEPARRIGLVPPGARVDSIEDAALEGAILALTEEGLQAAAKLGAEVRHVPLGDRADFQETFVSSMVLEEMTP